MHLFSSPPLQNPSGSQLQPGSPKTPRGNYLPLLSSEPDGFRSYLPHRAQLSTSLNKSAFTKLEPQTGVQSRYSGFRVQDTANFPPSTTLLNITNMKTLRQYHKLIMTFWKNTIQRKPLCRQYHLRPTKYRTQDPCVYNLNNI